MKLLLALCIGALIGFAATGKPEPDYLRASMDGPAYSRHRFCGHSKKELVTHFRGGIPRASGSMGRAMNRPVPGPSNGQRHTAAPCEMRYPTKPGYKPGYKLKAPRETTRNIRGLNGRSERI